MKPLVIRADANPEIGTGHVMRCLALAQAWQDIDGEVIFIISRGNAKIEDRLRNEGFGVIGIPAVPGSRDDATTTITHAGEYRAEWIVADGYHFRDEYQKFIKEHGFRLLVIDDYGHADYYYADIVLNQNPSATTSLYPCHEPYVRFLLGGKFVLLRREFMKWMPYQRTFPEKPKRVLVTLGGADIHNVTLSVIHALRNVRIPNIEVNVVVGAGNPHYEELEVAAGSFRNTIRLLKDVKDMPELMAQADFAICAGGGTSWEIAGMRLPSMIIIQSDNQQANAEELERSGIARNLGCYKSLSCETIRREIELFAEHYSQYAEKCSTKLVIDGKGARRVAAYLK